jgi:hypothetical protein
MTVVPASLPTTWASTRDDLHRVAVHVLARRRADLVGKIGLRASPGGIGTPAAGPDHEVVRTSGAWLLRERSGAAAATRSLRLDGATLAEAAALVEVDLTQPLDAGADTPALGDVDAPLAIDPLAATALGSWFEFGWSVLDEVVAGLGAGATPSVVQLWPEHFDAAVDVAVGDGRVNLGISPGDAGHPDPYLYVGPWGRERPGDAAYWNAPFGAVLAHPAIAGSTAARTTAVSFVRRGVDLVGGH